MKLKLSKDGLLRIIENTDYGREFMSVKLNETRDIWVDDKVIKITFYNEEKMMKIHYTSNSTCLKQHKILMDFIEDKLFKEDSNTTVK